MRLRKQKEVAKQNEFYANLLLKALPCDSSLSHTNLKENILSESQLTNTTTLSNSVNKKSNSANNEKGLTLFFNQPNHGTKINAACETKVLNANNFNKKDLQLMEHHIIKKISIVNDFEENCQLADCKNSFKTFSNTLSSKPSCSINSAASAFSNTHANKWNLSPNHVSSNCFFNSNSCSPVQEAGSANKKTKNILSNNLNSSKDDTVLRLVHLCTL